MCLTDSSNLVCVQYLGALNNYNTAITYLCREPKYRTRAMDIAKNEGLINNSKKKKRTMTKVRGFAAV